MPRTDESALLRVLDVLLGLSDVARGFRRRTQELPAGGEDPLAPRGERSGSIEAHLGGVLVAALKETFDRDRERTELERQHLEFECQQREADRRRADEALRLEFVRQAGERETARLRLLAIVASVVWIISAAFLGRLAAAGFAAHVVLAVGWLCLLAGLVALFGGYRTLNERLAAAPDIAAAASRMSPGRASAAADWLVLAGALLSGEPRLRHLLSIAAAPHLAGSTMYKAMRSRASTTTRCNAGLRFISEIASGL